MSFLGRYVVTLTLLVAACGRGVHLQNETKPIVYIIQQTVTDENGGTVLPPAISAVELAVEDVNEIGDAPLTYSLEWLNISSQVHDCNKSLRVRLQQYGTHARNRFLFAISM